MNGNDFGPVIVASVVATVIALVGLWANRKAGLNPAADRLALTLQATLAAQTERIDLLEVENKGMESRVNYLEQRNRDLEREVTRLRALLRERGGDDE